jgi:hypothetical protein
LRKAARVVRGGARPHPWRTEGEGLDEVARRWAGSLHRLWLAARGRVFALDAVGNARARRREGKPEKGLGV